VLLGGATALLPIYARDILMIGPWGLGLLRTAPAVGALTLVALFRPASDPAPRRRIMFAAVATFGIATVVFGLSHWFWLSFAALVFLGASDVVSVVIRSSLVAILTPDVMRGRVNAVNSLSSAPQTKPASSNRRYRSAARSGRRGRAGASERSWSR